MTNAHRPAARRRHRPRDHGRRQGAARARRRVRARRAARGRRLDRRARHARSPTRCWRPAAAPTRCCSPPWAARSGTPPTRTRRGPSRACSACARSSACSRTSAPCARAPRCSTPARCKRERIEGTDLIVVRELTGGIYFGDRGLDGDTAHDTCVYSEGEIERIARVGVPDGARARSRAWTRRTSSRPRGCGGRPSSASRSEESLPLEHMLVDNAAMQLVSRPAGVRRDPHREHVRRHPERRGRDAHGLARHAAERLASARPVPGLFEPVHGSAPDIAGTGTRKSARHVRLGGHDAPQISLWKTPPLP